MRRREFIPALATPAFVSGLHAAERIQRKGRLKQCVTGGVFGRSGMPFEDRCREAARLGIVGYDLVGPETFPILKKYGLLPTMCQEVAASTMVSTAKSTTPISSPR